LHSKKKVAEGKADEGFCVAWLVTGIEVCPRTAVEEPFL
jgi:hypothetical protein